jgi:hypothetical protein
MTEQEQKEKSTINAQQIFIKADRLVIDYAAISVNGFIFSS